MSVFSIVLNDLTLGYDRHPAIHHLSAEIKKGSLTAIIGLNGSGKSTLLKGIMGSIKPISGSCSIDENSRIAYLPQKLEIDFDFPAQVNDLITLGLWHEIGFFKTISSTQRKKISESLDNVGLSNFESRQINTLSGGQIQRVLFARVCLQDADIILLDEPFTGIDSRSVSDLLDIIKKWHEAGKTILVVLHDMHIVREHFPETMVLARHLVALGKTEEILETKKFLSSHLFQEAWIENAPWCYASIQSCVNTKIE